MSPIHLVGGTSYSATVEEEQAFAQLVTNDGHLPGWSLYDWFGTKPPAWNALAAIPQPAAESGRVAEAVEEDVDPRDLAEAERDEDRARHRSGVSDRDRRPAASAASGVYVLAFSASSRITARPRGASRGSREGARG